LDWFLARSFYFHVAAAYNQNKARNTFTAQGSMQMEQQYVAKDLDQLGHQACGVQEAQGCCSEDCWEMLSASKSDRMGRVA